MTVFFSGIILAYDSAQTEKPHRNIPVSYEEATNNKRDESSNVDQINSNKIILDIPSTKPEKKKNNSNVLSWIWWCIHHWLAEGALIKNGIVTLLRYKSAKFAMLPYKQSFSTLPESQFDVVKTTLANVGLDPNNIDIKLIDSYNPQLDIEEMPALALSESTIALDPKAVSEWGEEEIRFITAHEASHIINKDVAKIAIACIVVPILTHFGIKYTNIALEKLIQKIQSYFNLQEHNEDYQALKKFAKVTKFVTECWITKFLISSYFVGAYSRYVERRADIFAAQKLHCAQGGIAFLKRFRNKILNFLESAPPALKYFYAPNGDVKLDKLHPPISERIEYLSTM